MRGALTMGVVVTGLAVLTAGCATKGFVREELAKQDTAMGQRVGVVEGRVGTEAQRLDRESQRIGKVEGGVTEQGQRLDGLTGRVTGVEGAAADASARADGAAAKAGQVDERLTRLWSKRHARSLVESLDVRFAFGRAELSDGAQTALIGVIKELKENPGLTVDLLGYTDGVGSRESNVRLSQRRVEAVRRYLVDQGVDLPRVNAIGLGPATKKVGDEAAKNRRVTVKLMVAE